MKNKELEYFKGDELAASTWRNKYAFNNESSPDDTHKRMAVEFSRIEDNYRWDSLDKNNLKLSNYGYQREHLTTEKIYELFKNFKYVIPGGSVMSSLGTNNLVSLSNCFIIGSPKDSYAEIMKTRNFQIQLSKRRGGVGYDLSKLRPRSAKVNNAAKSSTGAASFLHVNSELNNEVSMEGRRGALMQTISINHPDVEEFINKKQDLTKITGANLSVKVTNEFMKAVENNLDYFLRFPIDTQLNMSNSYELYQYNLLYNISNSNNSPIYIKKVKAKELWDNLIKCSHNTAEPGIIFEDRMINYSPDGVYNEFKVVSTNPCGEIGAGEFDSCRLIHSNLTSYVIDPFTDKARIDEELLYKNSYETMRLADDLVTLEIETIDRIIESIKSDEDYTEFNLWNRIKNNAIQGRRCGVGFTGLADLIAMLGIKYGSEDSIKIVDHIMKIKFLGELDSTIDMAIERSPFPAWKAELENKDSNEWYKWVWENYPDRARKMAIYGRRNISFSTVAPTGTVSILAQGTSGVEPLFLPFYERKRKCNNSSDRIDYTDNVGENYTIFTVVHPNLKKWVIQLGFNIPPNVGDITSYIENEYTLDNWEEAFKASPYYGATAPDIDWKQRIKLQSVIQKYITHSISSTINLPNETTPDTISDIYLSAWREGNKGQTVYRDGCRDGILNSLNNISSKGIIKRPKNLPADYYQIKVKGEQFIVLVGLLNNRPYEVFTFRPLRPVNIETHQGTITKVRKMKYTFDSKHIQLSDLQLSTDNKEEIASTLYTSALLRSGMPIEFIIKTAKKVNDNITSFSSAMCRVLSKYVEIKEIKGEVCPNCKGKLIRESGCIKCLDCNYSKCE